MNSFLDKAYSLGDAPEATRRFYDEWSASYEDEVAKNGYVTPERLSRALANALPNMDVPVLDFGCGTGLGGLALRNAGVSTVDGVDISERMLDGARARPGLYRKLWCIPPGEVTGVNAGDYAAIAAIGVIGSGAAPVGTIDMLVALLGPGALFAFSFNDHTLEKPVFEARIEELVAQKTLRARFREYGPHLPARNLKSVVCVYERLTRPRASAFDDEARGGGQ